MSWAGLVVALGAVCGMVALLVGLGVSIAIQRRQRTTGPKAKVDPDRDARDADRRRQQLLLGLLSRTIAPREVGDRRWSPRASNPTTRRAVLAFDGWRPVRADGARKSRRKGPEALIVGDQWPFILAVDLAGLSAEVAADVAQEIASRVADSAGTRVRLLTGPGETGPVRSAVEGALQSAGVVWTGRVDGLDVASTAIEPAPVA